MDDLDDMGAPNSMGVQDSNSGVSSGMESPTELVSSTIHGFPEVKTEQQQPVFVLAAPQPQMLQQQHQQQQQQGDLYALTLSDGSVVHFKIENNTNAIQGEGTHVRFVLRVKN